MPSEGAPPPGDFFRRASAEELADPFLAFGGWVAQHARASAQVNSQVSALLAASLKSRKRFRRLEYICSACGDSAVQVFATSPFWALVFRSDMTAEMKAPPTREQAEDPDFVVHPDWDRERLRLADWEVMPLPDWLPGPQPQAYDTSDSDTFDALCRCSRHPLALGAVLDDLVMGRKERRLSK